MRRRARGRPCRRSSPAAVALEPGQLPLDRRRRTRGAPTRAARAASPAAGARPGSTLAPYSRISVTPSARKSSQRCAGMTTRSRPSSSWNSQRPSRPGVVPISASVSSRWSMHLRRGGRIVDRGRQRADRDVDEDAERERRILVDRALDPERDHAREAPLGIAVAPRSPCTWTSAAPLETKSPDRVRQHEHAVLLPRPARRGRARRSPGSRRRAGCARRARAAAPASARISSSSAVRFGVDAIAATVCAATCARPARRAPPPRPAAAGARRGRGRPGRARSPRRGRSRTADAEVRDGVRILDAAEQREREVQRADQHREHGLEDPVAVPEPHVARRERPGRHLHDEHADRDDEAGQPAVAPTTVGEHGERRARRVLPPAGTSPLSLDPDDAEARARSRRDRRRAARPRGCP